MKKYTTPQINVRLFGVCKVLTDSSTDGQQQYVAALENVQQKTRVTYGKMEAITKFTF